MTGNGACYKSVAFRKGPASGSGWRYKHPSADSGLPQDSLLKAC